MAIYHFSAKTIKRSDGRSSVASSAYRACERIFDSRRGVICDYTKKQDLVYAEILAPTNSPDWITNRSELWNSIEMTEKRKDAQLAREIEIALPVELTADEQIELVRGFVQKQFVDKGMVADVCIHEPDKEVRNPHAHIMLSMREVAKEGWGNKNRDWNDKDLLFVWREQWAEFANIALAKGFNRARIDHRSHEARGLKELPTIKLGSAVCQMEKRGIETEKGNYNRKVKSFNEKIREVVKVIGEVLKDGWDNTLEQMRLLMLAKEKEREKAELAKQERESKGKSKGGFGIGD